MVWCAAVTCALQSVCAGEGAALGTGQPKSAQILNIDVPFDGLGLISIPASETISPVFTMWITLVAMYTGMVAYGTVIGLHCSLVKCSAITE